jgi:hypothetical protein
MSFRSDDHCFVVLAYGESPFLEGCVKDLKAQTVHARILMTTSTPSAFVRDIAEHQGIELIVNPRREGIGADWNFGLNASRARYLTLAHQDDTYDPRFLERTLELFQSDPDAALCFTGYREIDDAGKERPTKISFFKHLLESAIVGKAEKVSGFQLRAFLSFGNPLPCSSVTFNRAKLPNFAFSLALASNLDWDAWWRLQRQGESFLHVSERLVGRRHNPLTETSRLIRDGVRRKEDLMMFRRLWPAPLGDAIAYLYRASY